MKLVPVYDNLVVLLCDTELAPSEPNGVVLKGLVSAVGEGRILENGKVEPMPFKVGQKVLFTYYVALNLQVGSLYAVVVSAPDVLAIVED